MDHIVCLNSNSFPAADSDKAYELFNDSLQGLLKLNAGADRYIIYHDSSNSEPLAEFKLSQDFTYTDFKEKLLDKGEQDILLFLEEFEDKSPAVDFLSEDIVDDLCSYSFYMPQHAAVKYPEVFGISWFVSAILLSIYTNEQWNSHKISIARVSDDGQYIDEELTIKNIARYEHGKSLYEEFHLIDIKSVCKNSLLTNDFVDWYEEQTDENKVRIHDKLKLACERQFNGGKPLFDTLNNADGLREMRFSAYHGGAIRILFKVLGQSKHAILVGFIKKSNNEGYSEHITKAKELFTSCVKEM
jgi:hypothetical protein